MHVYTPNFNNFVFELDEEGRNRRCISLALVFAVDKYLPFSFSLRVSLGGRNLINHRACLRWPGNIHPPPLPPLKPEFDKRRLLSQLNNSPISIFEILIRIRPSRKISGASRPRTINSSSISQRSRASGQSNKASKSLLSAKSPVPASL